MSEIKIIRLELINFARVYSGLGKTNVVLELKDLVNPINIFAGHNGTGKSSIMRCLHPFAYNNAMGISDNKSKLIMDKKSGIKRVEITLDDNIYTIQHYYNRKKDDSLSVESYIQENGTDLNENGTVTMFKDIVKEKLGVTESYLTLLSIGNSMSGFVDFTSADRKNFATKIFTDLAIYQEYHKLITAKARNIKSILNNVVDKLSKYANYDKVDIENQLNQVQSSLNSLNERKVSLSQSIGGIQSQLDDYKEIINEYKEYQTIASQLLDEIAKLESKKTTGLSKEELKKNHKELSKEISDLEKTYTEHTIQVTSQLDAKNTLMESISHTNDSISKLEDGTSTVELEQLLSSIDSELDTISGINPDKFCGLSKDDFIRLQVHLQELQGITNRFLLEVANESIIQDTFNRFKDDNKLYDRIMNKYNKLSSRIDNFNVINMTRIATSKTPVINCEDTKGCTYYDFYQDYMKIINQSVEESNNELSELKTGLNVLEDGMKCVSIIKDLFHYMNKNTIILKSPKEIFSPDTFIDAFMDTRLIYNRNLLSQYIDESENITRKRELLDKRESTMDKLSRHNSNTSVIQEMKDQVSQQTLAMENITNRLNVLTAETKVESAKLDVLKGQLEYIVNDLEICNEIAEARLKLDTITDRTKSMQDKINKIDDLTEKRNSYLSDMNTITNQLSELDIMKQKFIITLNDIKSLEEEEIRVREDYDVIMAIRKAVSPTTGIPLEFIEFYVKEKMVGKINELLDSVYHGRLRLLKDDIIVSDKEFTIPYKKNNTTINDISTASDGERAIMTLAFSLVLIQLSLTKYNIMLIDELDTTLDADTRPKFIGIIQKYMNMINSKQIFLVSHNNMFDMYDVNLIMTSEMTSNVVDGETCIKLFE